MKWKQSNKRFLYFRARQRWHRWFAWLPVKAEGADGSAIKIWLEKVERKGTYGYGGWDWRYRELI